MIKFTQSLLTFAFTFVTISANAADRIDKAGLKAPDFLVKPLDGKTTSLAKLNSKGPVVMLMLRGWPGYQCPLCSRQVGSFISAADEFAKRGAQLLLIYPGPGAKLDQHAKDFLKRVRGDWPDNFTFATDPDYEITNRYGIRWRARRETAYPATYVIDKQGIVRFAKVSRTHGGRSNTREVLAALDALE